MAQTSMRFPPAAGDRGGGAARPGRWSWRLGRLFGIEIRVHATFLLLLAWVALMHLRAGDGLLTAASGAAYVIAVFAIIVMHELGHALTARRFGVTTRDITLLPIGGVASLERMPSKPSQELLVAIAGPAVNVALALLLSGALVVMGAVQDVTQFTLVGGPFLGKLVVTNVFLAAFNLIPAFPMDGGRVLRSLLAMRLGALRATDVAARIGQGVALLFGLVGLFFNPFLVFIALFVWMGAQTESRVAHVHAALAGVPAWRAMATRFVAVSPAEPLASAAEHVLAGFQDDVPVVDGTRLVGVLAREQILAATLAGDASMPAASCMRRDVPVVTESDSLDVALERLQASGRRAIPVVRGGDLVGLLPVENVAWVLQARDRTPRR